MGLDLSAIRIKVQADTKEAEKGLSQLKKTGDSLASVGKKLTLGLTTPIVAAGTASLMAASNVGEMESKFNTVFKNLASEADEWATTYAKAIGRSKYEIKEAISNQADLYQGMGFTSDEAFNLSKQVTELGYDLASFNNVNDAQAVEAMTKALMGETESAKMLGVNLTDTIMETSEFTKATGKSWKQLSMAEKAQVRYKEAVKQSKNAIGDAEKTSDSFANMTKRVKGQLHEMSVEIGKVLLPIAEKFIGALSKMLDKITTMVKENPKLAQTIVVVAGAFAALGPTLFIVGKLTALFAAFPVACGVAVGALAGLALAFIGLNEKAQETLLALPEKIQEAINGMLTKIVEFLPQFLAKGTEMLFQLVEGILAGIPVAIQAIVDLVFRMLDTLFTFGPQFIQIGWDFVRNLLDGAIKKFPELISTFIDKIVEIIVNIKNRMPEFIAKGVEFVASMAKGFVENFPALISKVWELLTKCITTIIEKLPEFIKAGLDLIVSIGKGLWDNRDKIWQIIKDLMKGCIDAIKNTISGFFNMGKEIVNSLWNGVKSMWSSFTGWISDKISNIPIIGGFFKMTPEVDDSGLVAPDAAMFGSIMTRGKGMLDMPQLFGATSNSKRFETPKSVNAFDGLKDALEGLKGQISNGVVETVINIDGREFARTTTPYISRELAWATR